ncbi:MAG: methionine aminotransferase [Wenzhouxiangellaceae bacterium]|nr:methionine aminotransferase [Wenzhouxiangellaceae bacterium]
MTESRPVPTSSKLPGVGLSIFAVMSKKAADHGALNLAQGFPDFECPAALREAVVEAMSSGLNQYSPMPGAPALLERIEQKLRDHYGVDADAGREVTVTAGATEALFVAIQSCVRDGDEVVVLDPAYDSYEPAVHLAGGRCVHVPLSPPGYGIDFDRLADAITPRTRLVVVNTPHNPTGAVLSRDDLDRLADVLEGTDALLLSDEVYEHIVFDGARHASVLQHPRLRPRAFAVFSFGKTYHVTGWKIGYCVAPPALTEEFRKVHQYVTFCVSTPMQHAIAAFMADASFAASLGEFYQEKRDRFRAGLENSAWSLPPCAGTYFQLLGHGDFASESDTDMTERLLREAGVAAIPVSVFNEDGRDDRVLRMCFAKGDETLDAACEKLRAFAPA